MNRSDVDVARERLQARNVYELAHDAGVPVGVVVEVISGRLRPAPWIRQRLAAVLGFELLDDD